MNIGSHHLLLCLFYLLFCSPAEVQNEVYNAHDEHDDGHDPAHPLQIACAGKVVEYSRCETT